MNPKRKRNRSTYHVPAIVFARAALRIGPMVRVHNGYSSGPRVFYKTTVDKLLGTGEAVRIGTGVVHADHLRKEAAE